MALNRYKWIYWIITPITQVIHHYNPMYNC